MQAERAARTPVHDVDGGRERLQLTGAGLLAVAAQHQACIICDLSVFTSAAQYHARHRCLPLLDRALRNTNAPEDS